MTQFEYHNAGNDEASQRKSLAFMLSQVSTGKAATGVLVGLAVAQTTTASTGVLVGSGAGVVQAATLDGASLLGNDTQITLDVLVANPVGGLPRNDIVVFDQATLTTVGSGGSGGVRVIVGTPNASPTDPTVPASAIPLARLRHPASATTVSSSVIDDLRSFTRVALPAGVPFATASGGGNIGSSVAVDALSGPFPQTFPAGRFTQVPNLTFGTTDARCTVQGTSITTSGFNLYVRNNSSSTAPAGQIVTWTATQMTSSSANG